MLPIQSSIICSHRTFILTVIQYYWHYIFHWPTVCDRALVKYDISNLQWCLFGTWQHNLIGIRDFSIGIRLVLLIWGIGGKSTKINSSNGVRIIQYMQFWKRVRLGKTFFGECVPLPILMFTILSNRSYLASWSDSQRCQSSCCIRYAHVHAYV